RQFLGFVENRNGFVQVAIRAVQFGEEVQVVAQVLIAVKLKDSLSLGTILRNVVQSFDKLNLVLTVLDRTGQVSSGCADQGPALFWENRPIAQRCFGQQPFKPLSESAGAYRSFPLVDPVE